MDKGIAFAHSRQDASVVVSTIKMRDCEDAGQSIVPSGGNTESGPGLLEWDYDHNDGRRVSANKPAAVKTGASSKSN